MQRELERLCNEATTHAVECSLWRDAFRAQVTKEEPSEELIAQYRACCEQLQTQLAEQPRRDTDPTLLATYRYLEGRMSGIAAIENNNETTTTGHSLARPGY